MARLRVERAGAGVAVQDFGRRNFRALGVPLSGALDPFFLAAANALAGAPENAAGLELLLAAPTLRVEQGPLRLGLAGDLSGVLTRADGAEEKIAGWRGLVLRDGDVVALRLSRSPAYLGFSGGLDVPEILGARSTFLRGGFGGLGGRTLEHGDALACAQGDGAGLSAPPFSHAQGKIRFIPGPQVQNFALRSLALFEASDWRVGADSDRMGMRLSGPRLAHGPAGANIVSDGATPGAIQVPGDGQPIVLRADCQTSGGYAKIGCVIGADLGRLAHFAPGEMMGFTPVDHRQATQARQDLRENFARWRAAVAPDGESWDCGKLWSENLISGAISGK
ncbi:hypothetical protein [uncultured Rhodoblastus sp.]|uniref:5-oxoprolinase subunit C family protein n=1 Tax=uncultured Rhodoblastus sp. TaxID=543037 RepID=UPI0025D86D13|nr:hypothetical protein [uncultured Rhodoblastus sp.]